MPGKPKPTAREAFDDNLADAETLVSLAQALANRRVRRMRRELRQRVPDVFQHEQQLLGLNALLSGVCGRARQESLEVSAMVSLLHRALTRSGDGP